MFDRQLFLSHFGARQNGANNAQNFDKVVVDSQGVKWGFNQRKGIYENLNTGQRMNSILFENTNLSNAAAASDASSGWGVSNRSSDVNTPEIQALLTKKGSSRGKDFRRSDDVVSLATQVSVVATPESFLPLDAVFYGRIQGPYFDDMWQSNPSTPGPQWRSTGGRNKVYFNPFALLGGASGGTGVTYINLDNPNPQHIEVQSFKTWTPSNALGQKVGIEVVFGSTTDAKTAYDVIVGTTTGEGIFYHPTTVYGYAGQPEGDRGGRLTFFSRIATSGKTLAMLGDKDNSRGLKVGFPFGIRTAPPSQGTYSNAEREQMHAVLGAGVAWFDYSDWLSSGLTAGVTAELYSRTLWIPLGSSSNTYNTFSGIHYPLGNAFSTVVNNGATGYNLIQNLNPESIPSGNNFHNFMYNNPNGVGSTTPYAIEFAFFRGGGGSTAGLINDWTSFYGSTGNTAYQ